MATTEYPPAAFDAGLPPELRATYTTLRSGAWGIRVPGGARAGDRIAVYRKNGASTLLTVGRVLWTGPDSRSGSTVSIAEIGNDDGTPRPVTSTPASRGRAAAKRQAIPVQRSAPSPRSTRQAMPRIVASQPPSNKLEPLPPCPAGCELETVTCDEDGRCGLGARCTGRPSFVCPGCGAHQPKAHEGAPHSARAIEARATVEADKVRADAERALGLDEPLF